MKKRNIGFCSLVSIDINEKKATYEDMEQAILIELNHGTDFINFLSSQIDETQLCFWIDLEKKEIVDKEL